MGVYRYYRAFKVCLLGPLRNYDRTYTPPSSHHPALLCIPWSALSAAVLNRCRGPRIKMYAAKNRLFSQPLGRADTGSNLISAIYVMHHASGVQNSKPNHPRCTLLAPPLLEARRCSWWVLYGRMTTTKFFVYLHINHNKISPRYQGSRSPRAESPCHP